MHDGFGLGKDAQQGSRVDRPWYSMRSSKPGLTVVREQRENRSVKDHYGTTQDGMFQSGAVDGTWELLYAQRDPKRWVQTQVALLT